MNQDAKRLIYFTLIHSHLTYTNTVWSTHISGKQKKIIEKIQKYCLRSIVKKPHYTHTDPLFKSLKIMKFEDLRCLEQCKLAYKVKNKLMPKAIMELFDSLGKKKHQYNTREKNLPNIKRHKSDLYNKSFLCKSISYYNELNSTIKKSPTLYEFTNKYKKELSAK